MKITRFTDRLALTKIDPDREINLLELVDLISGTRRPSKEQLPLLKLATFGERQTAKGCLRHDANLKEVHGVEIDYDGEKIAFEEAVRRLRSVGVTAVLYTSPSHRPVAPRWRALLPFAGPRNPADRRGFALRAGEMLGITLGPDSLTLSQTYHFGRVGNGEHFQIEMIDGDPLDVMCKPIEDIRPQKSELVGEYRECTELNPHGEAALRSAAANIMRAPNREQERTLNLEGYCIGQLAAAGGVPSGLALEVLVGAAKEIPNHDPARPWRPGQAEAKVRRAFHQGWGKPRPSIEQLERDWAENDRYWAEATEPFEAGR